MLALSLGLGLHDEDAADVLGMTPAGVRERREVLLTTLAIDSGRPRADLESALRADLTLPAPVRTRARRARALGALGLAGWIPWAGLAIALGLAVGIAASVSVLAAVLLAGAVLGAIVAGVRPGIAAAALPALIFFEDVLPSGLAIPILLAALALLAFGRARVPVTTPLAWAAGFALWAFASALWTLDLAAVTQQYVGLALAVCFLVAIPALIRSESDLRMFLTSFVLLAAGTGVVGVINVATGSAGRAGGWADGPNSFAMYQVIALPMAFLLAAQANTAWARTLGYGAVAIIAAAVLAAASRGGLIALGVVLLALLTAPGAALYRSAGHRRTIAAVTVAAALVTIPFVYSGLSERLTREDVAAGSGRVNEWRTGIKAFGDRPVVGLGFGGYFAASNDLLRATPGVDLRSFRLTEPGVRVHSAYIGAAAELGAVGLTLFAGLLLSTALALRRSRGPDSDRTQWFVTGARAAVLLGLAGFAVASLFLSTEASFALFMLVGLAVALQKPLGAASDAG